MIRDIFTVSKFGKTQYTNYPWTWTFNSVSICIPQLKLTASPNSTVLQTTVILLLILRQAFASTTQQNLQRIRRTHINLNLFLLQEEKHTKHGFAITAIEAKIILAITMFGVLEDQFIAYFT